MKKGNNQLFGIVIGLIILIATLFIGLTISESLRESNCPSGSTSDDGECYICSTGSYDTANNYCINSQTDTLNVSNTTTVNLTVQSNLISASGSGVNSTGGSITSDLTFNYTAGNVQSTSQNYTNANISYQYSTDRGLAGSSALINATRSLDGSSGLGLVIDLVPIVLIILLFVIVIGALAYMKV